jgi:hypothetical protein
MRNNSNLMVHYSGLEFARRVVKEKLLVANVILHNPIIRMRNPFSHRIPELQQIFYFLNRPGPTREIL